jgi:hypothetical protein
MKRNLPFSAPNRANYSSHMTNKNLPPQPKNDIVQVKNPKTGHYVKIDRSAGRILDQKKSDGPYKGIPVARKRG